MPQREKPKNSLSQAYQKAKLENLQVEINDFIGTVPWMDLVFFAFTLVLAWSNHAKAETATLLYLLPISAIFLRRLLRLVFPNEVKFHITPENHLDLLLITAPVPLAGGYYWAYHLKHEPSFIFPYVLLFMSFIVFNSSYRRVFHRGFFAYIMFFIVVLTTTRSLKQVFDISSSFLMYVFLSAMWHKGFIIVMGSVKSAKEENTEIKKSKQHQEDQMKKAFYPHQTSMMGSFENFEDTMPTHEARCLVWEIDLIESRKYRMDGFSAAQSKAFSECYEILLERYNMTDAFLNNMPSSFGHLHKEGGDGFRIVIGYPFPVPPEMTEIGVALYLAEKFSTIFKANFSDLAPDSECRVAVAITQDMIRGYWNHYKVKSYEFTYKAIARNSSLAKIRRVLYERRSELFDPRKSIFLLEGSLIEQMPLDWKDRFKLFNLEGAIKLREAHMDNVLYFQF